MSPGGGVQVLGVVVIVWLIVLSFLFWKERKLLQRLIPKTGERDIRNKFKEVLEVVEEYGRNEKKLIQKIADFHKESLGFIQRIEISKYNPYADTGGDQSFTMIMLDGRLNGLVLTSLHSRAGTRVYAKTVIKGESQLQLSKEEKAVLKKATESAHNV